VLEDVEQVATLDVEDVLEAEAAGLPEFRVPGVVQAKYFSDYSAARRVPARSCPPQVQQIVQ
jgi:hypothetical protein